MADMFDPSQQPNMSPNDPAMYGNPADAFQYPGNAMYQQQQQMLGQTYYSDPSIQITRPGMGQTMSIASNQLSGHMSNVLQGTMQASGDLMRTMSNFNNGAHRFVSGPRYKDQYFGPNNFALETSMRRELSSAVGFDHNTILGRFMLGGYRPDFMTESDFSRQMDAAKAQRFQSGNIMDFTANSGLAVSMMFAMPSLGLSLVAPLALKGITHGIRSFNQEMREEEAISASWAKRANMRIGYGAEGFLDRTSDAEIARQFEHHDLGHNAGTAAFLGKTMSKKFGFRPEIQYDEVRTSMEELGMFSQRMGRFDDKKITEAVKGIADEMKQLAGIARVLKEEIPKAAAELQKAGGFGYEQKANYMGLTKAIAGLSATTGLDFGALTGATSQMMQMARGAGFGTTGTALGFLDSVQSINALKSSGMLAPGVDEVSFAQNLQVGVMQNARNNPFFMMSKGQSTDNFRNEMMGDPKKYFNNRFQGQTGKDAIPEVLKAMGNYMAGIKKHASAEKIAEAGERNLLAEWLGRTMPNMDAAQQKSVLDMYDIGEDEINRRKVNEAVLAQSRNGELERKLITEKNFTKEQAKEEVRKLTEIARGDSGGMPMLLEQSRGGGNMDRLTSYSKTEEIFKDYGGVEAVRNKEIGGTSHYAYAKERGLGWKNLLQRNMASSAFAYLQDRQAGRAEFDAGMEMSLEGMRKEGSYKDFIYGEKRAQGKGFNENEANKKYLYLIANGDKDLKDDEGLRQLTFGKNYGFAKQMADRMSAKLDANATGEEVVKTGYDLAHWKAADELGPKADAEQTAKRAKEINAQVMSGFKLVDRIAKAGDSSDSRVERLYGKLGGRAKYSELVSLYDPRKHYVTDEDVFQASQKMNKDNSLESQINVAEKVAEDYVKNGGSASKEEVMASILGRGNKTGESVLDKVKATEYGAAMSGGSEETKDRMAVAAGLVGTNAANRKWVDKIFNAGQKTVLDKYFGSNENRLDFNKRFRQIEEEERKIGGADATTRAQFKMGEAIKGQVEEFRARATGDDRVALDELYDSMNASGQKGKNNSKAAATYIAFGAAGAKVTDDIPEDAMKAAMNTYRGLKMSGLGDDQIKKDLGRAASSKYSEYFSGTKKDVASLEKDKRAELAHELTSNRTFMSALEHGTDKNKEMAVALRKGGELGPDVLQSALGQVQNLRAADADKIDVGSLDLFDKKTASDAIMKLNELLGKVVTAMSGGVVSPEPDKGNGSNGTRHPQKTNLALSNPTVAGKFKLGNKAPPLPPTVGASH